MDTQAALQFVERLWDESITPTLSDYIRIPAKSPHFDASWERNGHIDAAVELAADWCRRNAAAGMELEVARLPGRTPVLLIDIPGNAPGTVLLYGHLDKQPEMSGWNPGLGPWEPVLRDGKLYGRGGADDGYAVFASLASVLALQEQGLPHAHCVFLIECCEESGSYDLPHYIEALRERIGKPELVICLDSGCGNYDQLWLTTSLRGMASGTLNVEILSEGVHSGDASGIVPDTFRIARRLLERLEQAEDGCILPQALHVDIPKVRRQQAAAAAEVLGDQVHDKFPFLENGQPVTDDRAELVLNRTWRPALAITGAEGLPAIENAGNVLRPRTALKVSLRLPPMLDGEAATQHLKEILESDPPYGARVSFTPDQAATGWNAPALAPWLAESVEQASQAFFGKPAMYMGEGGTIPFMAMLGEQFPDAQFVITGVLGPHSNAHGPNEFLHLATGKRVTACVAKVLADHASNRS